MLLNWLRNKNICPSFQKGFLLRKIIVITLKNKFIKYNWCSTKELKNLKTNIKPHEILLVVDSMTGQDAVNIAQTFNENVDRK